MAKTLTLTGPLKGKTWQCMNQLFVDGVLVVQKDDEADKVFRALSKFYPLTMDVPAAPLEEPVATPFVQGAGAKTVDPNVTKAVPPKPAVKETAPAKAKTDK
jgi:hypothetical protein